MSTTIHAKLIRALLPLAGLALAATLSACGATADQSPTPSPTPTTTAASPSTQTSPSPEATTASPSETATAEVSTSPSETRTADDTEDSASGLSTDTAPKTIGDYKAFPDEVSGVAYSKSGDGSTPAIYVVSMGTPENFDIVRTSLGDDARQLEGDASFCDASATEASCYFLTADEAFFVGGDADVPLKDVQAVTRELLTMFS